MRNDLYIEVDYHQKQKTGNEICGDVFLSHKNKAENRTITILSDGLGSGIKANILASMTASMALNFIRANSPIEHTAKIIMKTLPVDSFRKISFSSFTIIDIVSNHKVKLIEYGNPEAVIWKKGKYYKPKKTEILINQRILRERLSISEFEIGLDDRIVLFSDGITQSGMGYVNTPFGWGRDNLCSYLQPKLRSNTYRTAGDLTKAIINQALRNDLVHAKDDMTCGAIFFRKPRKLLFCTGPPFNKENDKFFVEKVKTFSGQKIVSGGTTAQIISRFLNEEISIRMDAPNNGLPPESEMNGVELVTEGVLTIAKVSELLQQIEKLKRNIPGPAGKIIRYFQENDEIHFLVGTKVNEAHQDPSLPVELEIRRNVIKKIARLLEDKFLKRTEIEYI